MQEANSHITSEIKRVLTNFAVPNSSTLLQASKDLHDLSQNSSFLTSMFYILSTDESAQLRQTAAVVFRRKVAKQWKSFDASVQVEIRQAILQCLINEKEKVVQHSIMEIIGSIAKEELSRERQWPELLNYIETTIQTADPKLKECAAELLKIVCETCAEYFEGHFDPLLILINKSLESHPSTSSSFFCVEAFNYLVPYLGDDQARFVRPLVPKCVQVIKMLLTNGCESQASELIELFESLVETEVSFIAAYVKDLVVFLLEIAGNVEMDDDIRTRVLSVLQSIVRLKKKTILKNKLLGSILEVICPILVSPLDDSNENDEAGFIGDSADVMTPLSSSLRVIDDMALHFPPSVLYKYLIPFIEGCVASDEERFKRGLLLVLACVSEGTSEYIKSNHLRQFLEVVYRGIMDPRSRVRNAALFALGQFSEHLQPDINEFASEIMPILFQILNTMSDKKRGTGITKAYYALENFVENLESGILPYLERLMQHLIQTLKSTLSVHIKELIISAIGAVSNASQEHLLPFLPEILEQIQHCLSSLNSKEEDGEMCILHTQALDTLSVLVRNLGKLHIQLAEDSMKLGMRLVDMSDADPDLRRSSYGLFAAVASVVGENMGPFLSSIIRCIVNSIQSTEGIIPHYNSKESGLDFSFLDDSTTDLENGDDEIESELVDGFSVENAYMDEKIDAIDAIGDFAKHCGKSFEPHLNICLEEVVKLKDFPHADIRKGSITAFGQLIIASYSLNHTPPSDIKSSVFPLLSNMILTDRERLVVMAALTAAKEILEACGLEAMANKNEDLKALMSAVLAVFQQKSACQDDDINDDEDDQQEYGSVSRRALSIKSLVYCMYKILRNNLAEYDEMLLEYCGELFPILAERLKQDFLPDLLACLPSLLSKMKPNSTTSEKSFSAGIIAETVEKLGPCCPEILLKNVVPRFVQLSRDSEPEVRNNAIFGLGVLLQNGGDGANRFYPIVLNCLSSAIQKENSRRVIDNILSSLARMITANKELLPMKEILPVFLSHLPIQEDHNEDEAVYGCLATLMRDSDVSNDINMVAKILNIFALAINNNEVAKVIKDSVENEVKHFKSQNHNAAVEIINANKSNALLTELLHCL